ncbi:MAG: hypothetical protein GY706_15295 [Bacteroides sp.]|nr:hypothetical protein [Bacteroides sp.]
MKKRLTNKRLVSYLMDERKIAMVTVDKRHVVAQCTKAFMPSDLNPLVEHVGQAPKLSTSEGTNYMVFDRY